MTALKVLDIFARCPRKATPDGTFTITLCEEMLSEKFNHEVYDAIMTTKQIPELATLLEIHVLEMQIKSATNRLKNITG